MKILLITLLLVQFCFSATLNVPEEYGTIQAGIGAASNGDTVLVGPGTYVESINFGGKNIVVFSSHGADDTVIDWCSSWSTVRFLNEEDSTAVLEGFTIGGSAINQALGDERSYPDYGGGIYIEDSSPTIRNNLIIT